MAQNREQGPQGQGTQGEREPVFEEAMFPGTGEDTPGIQKPQTRFSRRNLLIGAGSLGGLAALVAAGLYVRSRGETAQESAPLKGIPATKPETPVGQLAAQKVVTDTVSAQSVVTDARKVEATLLSCRDGELVLNHNVPVGEQLPRTPVGEAERANIIEVAWWGDGFGGYDRSIIVVPQLGPVWQVNVKQGAATIATRGFCGTPEEVEAWAVKAHIPSLQQASRDSRGNQPKASEIAVYRLHFENQEMRVAVKANDSTAPTPEWVLSQLDVSFREGNKAGPVQMHVAK